MGAATAAAIHASGARTRRLTIRRAKTRDTPPAGSPSAPRRKRAGAAGEGLRPDLVVLLPPARAPLQQALGLLDLARGAAGAGDPLHVAVELLLRVARLRGTPLGHAGAVGDQVDQHAEERQDDQEDHPQRLDPA